MAMLSVTDLFYGERESVQILKDEEREIIDIIHRYNYFYTDPPPLSDAESDGESDVTTDDSEEEDLESNWQEVEESPRQSSARQSSVQDADDSKDGNEEKFRISNASQPEEPDAKVILKVPMRCPECEETVTIALKNVAVNQPITVGYSSIYPSSDNYRCLLTLVGIISVVGIIVVLTTTSLH